MRLAGAVHTTWRQDVSSQSSREELCQELHSHVCPRLADHMCVARLGA